MLRAALVAAALAALANAHLTAWHTGMYCLNGNDANSIDLNTESAVTPLYQLQQNDWWFHHVNNCDEFPPADGDFLELPAGGSFTVEHASNRAKTSLSYNGQYASAWPDGADYPADYNVPSCIINPNMHTQNQSMAAGTAFAISYESDIKNVTPENLVVFSVRYNTPWLRLTSYDVPAALPACPPGGCTCAWGWIPNGCGQPNMYHQAYKCKVTGATSTQAVGTPKPPVWCEGNPGACTKGPKQMLYWNQASGNNIEVSGYDNAGEFKSPAYNSKCGFADGAQNDIFTGGSAPAPPQAPPAATTKASSPPTTKPASAPVSTHPTPENTTKPAEATTKPAVVTTQPAVATTKPAAGTTTPAVGTTKPAVVTTRPAVATTEPGVPTTQPAAATTQPVLAETKPAVATTEPAAPATSSAAPRRCRQRKRSAITKRTAHHARRAAERVW